MTYNVELTGTEIHDLVVVLELKAMQCKEDAEVFSNDDLSGLSKILAGDAVKYKELANKIREVWFR